MEPTPRSMNELVEHRIQRWLLEQRTRTTPVVTPVQPRPIVTVSREAGAGGTELSRLVSERLGFRLWDQELVEQIAGSTGSLGQLLTVVDEHEHNAIEELFAGILMGDAFTGEGYVSRLHKVINTIADRGSAVIVGRGAQFVVPADEALRVRVVASLDARVRGLMGEMNLTEREARIEVTRIDRERHAFVRRYYRRDATDPSAYDVFVNTSSLSLPRAADLVAAAYHGKFPS